MAEKKAKRERGRILTESGWNKLDAALQAWEILPGNKRTFERIGHEAQLDPGTVAKIFKRKEGSDLNKLEQLFRTFQVKLDDSDHGAVTQTTTQADPNFVGREGAIADLTALINRDARVIVIQARGGVGKTTLARKFLQQEFDSFLEFPIAKETKDIASIESLIEEKLRQLGEEPGREFLVSIDRLKRKLQRDRIGILIDNLEPALDSAGKFIEPHRRYVELLRVLADPSVQSVTLITSRERLNEYSISVQHYLLGELSLDAWTQFFHNRFAVSTSEPKPFSDENQTALTALHNAYGGNAKAMDILCGAILTDYSGNIAAYWHANQNDLLIERPLEDLVVSQFDRLQQLDPDAYNLLCRMGCYRYQDVPTVPLEGLLCLLWDVPENRKRRVVKALKERSLVEFHQTEYWLHPIVKTSAIELLRKSNFWKETNIHAAAFWTSCVDIIETNKDALVAFEAYYHYLEIHDFEGASDVIINQRSNNWRTLSLGAFLYRMGLYQQLLFSIPKIINSSKSNLNLLKSGALFQILGNAYSAIGDIKSALKSQENSRANLDQHLYLYEKNFFHKVREGQMLSLFCSGLYNIDLWELNDAHSFFSQVIDLAEEVDSYDRRVKASSFLAFVKASLGDIPNALSLVDAAYSGMFSEDYKEAGGFDFYLWIIGRTYTKIGELQKSSEVYEKAFSDVLLHNEYTQTKARILIGMAELSRNKLEFEVAFIRQAESIEVLESIGAKCDLAEAIYQSGLTYQAVGEIKASSKSFQEAIRLFTEIGAPRQVERVRRSMAGSELASYEGAIQSKVDPLEYQREIRDEWS